MNAMQRSRLSTGCGRDRARPPPGSAPAADLGEDGRAPPSTTEAELPQGSEPVDLDPAEFADDDRQSLLADEPGEQWVFRETDTTGAEEKVVVEVTDETKTIANGVEAVVVRDTATEDGRPMEVETDDLGAPRRQDQGERLVPGRGHRRVREREGHVARGLVRGRSRGSRGRGHDSSGPAARHVLCARNT